MTALAATAPLEKTPLEVYVAPDKPSLVGVSRAGLIEMLAGIGVADRERKMRARGRARARGGGGGGRKKKKKKKKKKIADLALALCTRRARLLADVEHRRGPAHRTRKAPFPLDRPQAVTEQVSADGTRINGC